VHEQHYQLTQLGILPHLDPLDQKESQYPIGKDLPLAHPLRSYILLQLLIHHSPLLFAVFPPLSVLEFVHGFSPYHIVVWFIFLLHFMLKILFVSLLLSLVWFGFLAIVTAIFSNISRYPNPTLDT
jgi:hypothetical protein